MATEKQKRLQSAAMKTGYTINTLGEGKASRAENNIRQVFGMFARTHSRTLVSMPPGSGALLGGVGFLSAHGADRPCPSTVCEAGSGQPASRASKGICFCSFYCGRDRGCSWRQFIFPTVFAAEAVWWLLSTH